MTGVTLYPYQEDAVDNMRNGCVLRGGVGSGKSRTALAYYYKEMGGEIGTDEYVPMRDQPLDLYIITTARKRDTKEWEGEFPTFMIGSDIYPSKVVIDSWNNVRKYADVEKSFFIFDEQRVVGSGIWVKSFLKIAKRNKWVLLSATPGDSWMDYIPIFIANGFYRNRSEFVREHVVYKCCGNFYKVDRILNEEKLIRYRDLIMVDMAFERKTQATHIDLTVEYDKAAYREVVRKRWDIYKNEPVQNASGLCLLCRKIVNSAPSRGVAVLDICEQHPRVIIFYNFNFERDILRELPYGKDTIVAEWNGEKHEPVPQSDRWVYLVQYTAGCEGWNCITTDTMIFYSQNYSYKVMAQASGRIDRLNTPYTELYYYHLKSLSSIDKAIALALKNKHNFNEGKFVKW